MISRSPAGHKVSSLCPAHRSHAAHAMLRGLVIFRPARQPYEELRAALNSMRPEGFLEAPPFDEWTESSEVCNDKFCRCH